MTDEEIAEVIRYAELRRARKWTAKVEMREQPSGPRAPWQ